jgi:hypothetical protein
VDRDRLVDWVNSHVLLRDFLDEGKFVFDGDVSKVCKVKVHVATVRPVESSSSVDLAHLGT